MRHVAIIMDGNGRWAEKRGLPRTEGHRQGAEQVEIALDTARELGLEYLTLYAFSTENWKRPPTEVLALMNLLSDFLETRREKLMVRNVRLRAIGRLSGLPPGTRRKLETVMAETAGNTGGTLVLALNYGGRAEIADAAARIAADARDGKLKPGAVDEACFARYLYAPDIPAPELLIRTGGELRVSNFLLWEIAYSELYVTEVPWPDFGRGEFIRAVESFGRRDRRFGGIRAGNGEAGPCC